MPFWAVIEVGIAKPSLLWLVFGSDRTGGRYDSK
jgi:hypothetical protein